MMGSCERRAEMLQLMMFSLQQWELAGRHACKCVRI